MSDGPVSRAKAVAVFPRVINAAATAECGAGCGVVSRRTVRGWGSPVFLHAGGGAQIGASSTDYFLLLMNDRTVNGLMKDRFELGGQASVAAGPVGRITGAATDALHAAVLSYSDSQGVLTGVNLNGAVLQPEDELNMAVYTETAREMLSKHLDEGDLPLAGLRAYPQALDRYAATSSHQQLGGRRFSLRANCSTIGGECGPMGSTIGANDAVVIGRHDRRGRRWRAIPLSRLPIILALERFNSFTTWAGGLRSTLAGRSWTPFGTSETG